MGRMAYCRSSRPSTYWARGIGKVRLFTAALIALVCVAETKPPEPAVKKETKTVTRVVVITPVVRAPLRYYGYNLLGNLIGSSIVGAVEAHRNRMQQQSSEEPAAPYVPQYYEPPALSEVIIESNPPGAAVSINFQSAGKTPLAPRFEKPGTIVVMIRADGYDDYFHEYKVGPGEPLHVKENLQRHSQ